MQENVVHIPYTLYVKLFSETYLGMTKVSLGKYRAPPEGFEIDELKVGTLISITKLIISFISEI